MAIESLNNRFMRAWWILACAVAATSCGGGGSSVATAPPPPAPAPSPAPPPSGDDRVDAATATAQNNGRCNDLGSFYWEIGDANGRLASGSVGAGAPSASTTMSIASASKWVYAAYVVESVGVRADDVPYLNFTSGYNDFLLPLCAQNDTVQSCLLGHAGQDPDAVGRFDYDSGHMQHHAAEVMGLGSRDNDALSAEVQAELGLTGFQYTQPQLAGGLDASANSYAAFLRRILSGDLAIRNALGSHQVCTNPLTCDSALSTPLTTTESWSYSLGHWVEDDPDLGDGAFSSPGALGFYPWIDSSKSHYGIVARQSGPLDGVDGPEGYRSAQCGRLIRQAWRTGEEVTEPSPTP